MTDAAQHNKSINASPTRAMLDDLLGTRIAVQRDEMPQEGVKSAGNSAGYIAKAKTDLYMVKPVLKQGEIDKLNSDNAYKAYMQFLTYFNDFPLTQSSIINLMQAHLNPLASEHEQNRNIKSLESALNATLKAEKFSAEQKDLDPHQVLLLVLQNIDSHKEALQISNITSAKDTIFLKYDKEQMIHELAFGRAFNILLPGKASDVALVYTGNEVQKVNGMNVATIRPDKGSLDVGTRSKFLGPEFYTLHELQQKENGIAIWKDVRGFSDVVAASYMLGDYDIHSGNIGVIRRENVPKLDSTGKYSVNKDGEIIHQSNTNFATMNKEPVLESYWQAVKIDHGFAGTNIKAGAETHLSQDYINMSAAPSFAELKNDIIAHLNYGLPLDDKGKIDLHGKQSVLNVNLTPEQFKQSIDTMLQHKPEELIDSVGQRLYAAAQIGLMSREEADKKYKELAQSISDRYHGMKDLSVKLEGFLASKEYTDLQDKASSWLDAAVQYEKTHSIPTQTRAYPIVTVQPLFLTNEQKKQQVTASLKKQLESYTQMLTSKKPTSSDLEIVEYAKNTESNGLKKIAKAIRSKISSFLPGRSGKADITPRQPAATTTRVL